MSTSQSPSASDSSVEAEVAKYLESNSGAKLVEGKVVEYALERKISEVTTTYLSTRLWPSLAVIVAVLAYVGWDLKGLAAKAADDARASLDRATALQLAASQQSTKVSEALTSVAAARGDLERKLQDLSNLANDRFLRNTDHIVRLASSTGAQAANAAAQASAAGERVAAERQKIDALQAQLEKAKADASEIAEKLRFQARIINSSVIESVSLVERAQSAPLIFPNRSGPPLRVSFIAQKITSSPSGSPEVVVAVDVDGTRSSVSFFATPDGRWRDWRSLGPPTSNYEYRIEFVYYDANAVDFVTIQIRAKPASVDALQSSS